MEATLTFENDVVVKCPFVSQCHLVAQLRERIAKLEWAVAEWKAEEQAWAVERARLFDALCKIDGGDTPCDDPVQLRQWAYEAITLGRALEDE